jgi:hypothetical protein
MARYRKKPVEVDAFQMTFDKRWDNSDWPEWLDRAWYRWERMGGIRPGSQIPAGRNHPINNILICETLEGPVLVHVDDWIIQGIKGELYPCKPDIFKEIYELVLDK